MPQPRIAIVGGGPAGLMAAERLAEAGCAVTVYERMPSLARKFLMAGLSGLNLTHSEPLERFVTRYGAATERMAPLVRAFPPAAATAWAEGLGQPVFTGSSGRVFPVASKASPLLRAWAQRLERLGVAFRLRARWTGWDAAGRLSFDGAEPVAADATVLALGGASWSRLGSDGGWAAVLQARGVAVVPFRPSNCGFLRGWSPGFAARFAGQPLKPTVLSFGNFRRQGELTVTARGLESGVLYAASAAIRDAIASDGSATVQLDLRPGLEAAARAARLARARGGASLSTALKRDAGLSPVAAALLREAEGGPLPPLSQPAALAARIKACAVRLEAPAPLDEAISTAGGVAWQALDAGLMLRGLPGVFAAGEMLDWEAPTGGYLLQGCLATGVAAAEGVLRWLDKGAGPVA